MGRQRACSSRRAALLPTVLAAAALVLSAAPQQAAASTALVRGASPDNIAKYAPKDGKFTCFDGSLTIDFSQVNDNFCDCPDSSDEPGTSACPHGVFYCRNRGHEAKLLSTAFVDDGICDCCDGSDELSGCTNTCIEKNSAKRDELKTSIDAYKASLEAKARYAASAASVRSAIKGRFKAVDGDIAKAEKELERTAAARKKAEDESEAKRDQHRREQEAKAAQRKADTEAARKAEAAAAEHAAAAEQAAAEGGGGEAGEEESAEERGRRIAAQWTNDPAAAGPAASASEAVDAEGVKKDGSWSLTGVLSKAKDSVNKLVAGEAGSAGEDGKEGGDADAPPSPDDGQQQQDVDWASLEDDPDYEPFDDSDLRLAQTEADAAEHKLSELKAEKERVARQVTYHFNDAWAGLLNKCLEAREPQFTYKFCFFDKAVQVDNGGGHETSLGTWAGFEKGGSVAVFENGDYCHKAPLRSMRVKLECGSEERAWGASEPETCAYEAHASTPAACKPEALKELEAQMAALLAEEAALAKEIAEEEKQRQAQLAGMRQKMGAAAAGSGSHDEL